MNRDLRILIVDDQRPNLDLMEQLLAREGLHNVLSSTEPLRTLDLFNSFEPDLVILDLHMPAFDGFAVLEQLNRRIPANDYRSEEHTSELQSLMRISYAVFCLKKNKIYII